MKCLLLLIISLLPIVSWANDPSRPLIKTDMVAYVRCYIIDKDGRSFEPYTFFKIGKNYYEGVAFPFGNYDCMENYTLNPDSFFVNYEATIDSVGERKVYEKAKRTEAPKFEQLTVQDFPEVAACMKRENHESPDAAYFAVVRFVADYYIIRCDKPRNCQGPDFICSDYVDIKRRRFLRRSKGRLDFEGEGQRCWRLLKLKIVGNRGVRLETN